MFGLFGPDKEEIEELRRKVEKYSKQLEKERAEKQGLKKKNNILKKILNETNKASHIIS
ncbi:MAG: hypothetical protein ACLFVB_01590 [Thermoplasmata archaeon]